MIAARVPSVDIAAVRGALALLAQHLAGDRAAVYRVDDSNADGTFCLELVASQPTQLDAVPAPFPVPGGLDGLDGLGGVRYVADVGPRRVSGIRTYFGVPVRSGSRTIALIEMVAMRVDAFSRVERKDVLAFAPVLVNALESARRQEARSAFLAVAAHELRTPLASAAGLAETIARQLERLEPIVLRDLLDRILHNHRRLDRLVDDLVDLSSVDGGQLHVSPGPVIVGPLLEEAICGADDGSHLLSCDVAPDLPMVWADRDRLEQVVTNLLANAAKFSPEGSPICIRAGRRDETNEVIAIEVTDQGAGIPPERVDRIFDAYYQGEALLGGRPPGLGIGLYLTRVLCQLMGGKVAVESRPGSGSTFVVTLPAAPAAPPPSGG
jgi:signal transduction histidine kinase